ncbi:MAG: DUF2795 domain-containing protein [Armatimonadota bacterium]
MLTDDFVRNQFRGLNFPAGKGQIVEWAVQTDAPPELVEALQRLPELSYGNLMDLIYDLRPLLSQKQEPQRPPEPQTAV